VKRVGILLLASLTLGGCGGGSAPAPMTPQVSGNWQFAVANPGDGSFLGGLQGGFLQQGQQGSVTGQVAFSMFSPGYQGGTAPCNSGSATITGKVNGQNVTITAQAGTQASGGVTFTFNGQISLDNSTLVGSYTSTAGTAPDGTSCGTAQSGLQFSAISVPPITGAFQGSFHSTGGASGLQDQDFPLIASLTQGPNTGSSSATVRGTLDFRDPTTLISNYPCLSGASVTGEISGSSVILQVFATNGLNVGQIGGITQGQSVSFDHTQGGYVLHNLVGSAYAVNTRPCPGVSLANAGDTGNLCLSMANGTACTQPVGLSPASLVFPAQTLGSPATTQTITLANNDPSGATLGGHLEWLQVDGAFGGPSDFNGLPNFSETDTCASSPGASFTLAAHQICTITVTFSPQQSCPWLPSGTLPFGAAPADCPTPLTATLKFVSDKSADQDMTFAAPVSGTGVSTLVPSVRELDFGSEPVGAASLPQILTFTNQGLQSVQILPVATVPCGNSTQVILPHPLQNDGSVDGLRVVRTDSFATIQANPPTVSYFCDIDPTSGRPNLQISSDTCTGNLLAPQSSCSLQIAFVPQPGTNLAGSQANGLDYFLELNTLQCSSGVATDCEIDSGRFPLELRTNPPSPIRMSPGAGLDFGLQSVGKGSSPLTITLFNDPNDPHAGTVNFSGIVPKGDYAESDSCGSSLAPGNSCTVTVTFKPKIVGFDPGSVALSYNGGQIQTIYLRGTGQ
jgi:hypothetical protein